MDCGAIMSIEAVIVDHNTNLTVTWLFHLHWHIYIDKLPILATNNYARQWCLQMYWANGVHN